MVTYKKQLQTLFDEYERTIGRPGTPRDAIEWGLENGKIALPQLDPKSALIDDMKDALRTKTRTDAAGREYRAYASITFTGDGGVQESLWGDVDLRSTPPEFMIEHFGQRRKSIIDDCVKLKADVDHYNGGAPQQLSFDLILDFTDDVAEREAVREESDKAAE